MDCYRFDQLGDHPFVCCSSCHEDWDDGYGGGCEVRFRDGYLEVCCGFSRLDVDDEQKPLLRALALVELITLEPDWD